MCGGPAEDRLWPRAWEEASLRCSGGRDREQHEERAGRGRPGAWKTLMASLATAGVGRLRPLS